MTLTLLAGGRLISLTLHWLSLHEFLQSEPFGPQGITGFKEQDGTNGVSGDTGVLGSSQMRTQLGQTGVKNIEVVSMTENPSSRVSLNLLPQVEKICSDTLQRDVTIDVVVDSNSTWNDLLLVECICSTNAFIRKILPVPPGPKISIFTTAEFLECDFLFG